MITHCKLTTALASLIDILNLTHSGFQLASAQSAAGLKRREVNYALG